MYDKNIFSFPFDYEQFGWQSNKNCLPRLALNWKEYDRRDSFPFDYERISTKNGFRLIMNR